jgi:hypothetical protein
VLRVKSVKNELVVKYGIPTMLSAFESFNRYTEPGPPGASV